MRFLFIYILIFYVYIFKNICPIDSYVFGDCSRVTAGPIDLLQACVQKPMFFSRGDRDLGVAFQTHPGRQAFISSGSKVMTNLDSIFKSRDITLPTKICLVKAIESPLDCKEIQQVQSKGDQPWDFFGRNDAQAETPVLWPPDAKN